MDARDVDVFTGVRGASLELTVFKAAQTAHSPLCEATVPSVEWDDVITFEPPAAAAQQTAATRGQPVLSIFKAAGDQVNLDYWGVTVQVMPLMNEHRFTPQELLRRISERFSGFLGSKLAKFRPLEPVDEAGWKESRVGTLLLFRVPADSVLGPTVERIAPVMLASSTPMAWRFVTLGHHPVSGTREFGIHGRSDGQWEIYTRGADRVTSAIADVPVATGIFSGADQLWEAFQDAVAKDIQSLGGKVSGTPTTHKRYCWANVLAHIQGVH